ncbi:MAG TPA: hypothetical protein VJ859_14620 [Allosphingosinicella sp.]|nr:hypothetical protein [Allosphingosinicella sp.]
MSITALKKKLENPFALIAQGFVIGLILFGLVMPHESSARDADQTVASELSSQG